MDLSPFVALNTTIPDPRA